MSICIIDIINKENNGVVGEEKEFNQRFGKKDTHKSIEDLEYIERMKARKNVGRVMKRFSPSNKNEIYSIGANGKSVSKLNWCADDLFNALYNGRSSVFIPLGSFEKMGSGYYYIGDGDVIYSDPSLYSHENGHFGLFVNLELNQIKYEYAYCENYGGVSLDGENCDFYTLEKPSEEDEFEFQIFKALSEYMT